MQQNNNNKHDEQHEDRFTGNALLITFILLVSYILYDLYSNGFYL